MLTQPPIFLVGEAYGSHEARLNQPFVGPSGAYLFGLLRDSKLINLTKADRYLLNKFYETDDGNYISRIWAGHPELYRTNVFNLQPRDNELEHLCGPIETALPGYPPLLKGKNGYVRAEFEPELDRLRDEVMDRNPNLIICLGNTPLWALAGRPGIKAWRGATLVSSYTVDGFKLLPTYHPAYVIRDIATRPIVIADLKKAARESLFPEIRRPHRDIWVEPNLEDIERFITQYCRGSHSHRILSTDIETAGTRITCIGIGYSDVAIVIPFDDERRKGRSYWPTPDAERKCWDLMRQILSDPTIPKLFQNGLYDIAFLQRSMRIKVLGAMHDTMLLHHSLQPEMVKDLGFLGSLYTDECAWKNLGRHSKSKTIKRDA